MGGCWKSPFPHSWDLLTAMAPWGVSHTLCHAGTAPSPSARCCCCCGSVSSNRNASGVSSVNDELEELGMRAELRSWRLIVDKIPDQGAPARICWRRCGDWGSIEHYGVLKPAAPLLSVLVSSFRQETGA